LRAATVVGWLGSAVAFFEEYPQREPETSVEMAAVA